MVSVEDSIYSAPEPGEFFVLDLDELSTLNHKERKARLSKLEYACQNTGAFYLKSPYFSVVYLNKIRELLFDYFSLPIEEKLSCYIGNSPYHRGYFPIGDENAKGSEIKDQKEGFDFALHLPPDDEGYPLHGPNIYPESPSSFQNSSDCFYHRLIRTSERICEIFSEVLDLPFDFFLPMVTKPLAQLRFLHYPASEKQSIGAGEHTDYGFLTIIWQDNVGGLEIRNREGALKIVPPKEGLLFCNIGDMMQRLTNDQWVAARHRVINRSKESRYSTAFFFDPNFNTVISPLSKFVTEDIPPKYPSTTMGEYLRAGFDETFIYREPQS